MAESLLASLYSRIKGSQEDVATASLQYILSSSEKLNLAFNKLLSDSLKMDIGGDIRYSCQSVGEDKERPDMSGIDADGNEIVLCEMKFYAGLTENQPNGYLDRLISNGGKALVFVCPETRKVSLWRKVTDCCKTKGRLLSDEADYRTIVDGINMGIVTWAQVIDTLYRVASSDVINSKSDIEQLAGFCAMMDNTSFIPYSPEEMDPIVARKEDRNFQVLDTLFDKLVANKSINASGSGLKASAWRGGYTRYIKINGNGVALIYSRSAWMSNTTEDTPFWFYFTDITDIKWKQSDELRSKLRGIPNSEKYNVDNVIAIALQPLFYATLDEVTDDLMKQVLDRLESVLPNEEF